MRRATQLKLRAVYESIFGTRRAQCLEPWTRYLRDQKIAGYIGWVGYRNFGDELLFDAIHELLEPVQTVLYSHPNAQEYNRLAAFSPIELSLYRRLIKSGPFYDLVLVGGGTLILDPWYLKAVKTAISGGVPLVVFGTGVREEAYVTRKTPSRPARETITEWISLLKDATTIKVRGPLSAEILRGYGLRPEVIGDPALLECVPEPRGPRGRRIGISLGGADSLIYGTQDQINNEVARTASRLAELGWKVEWLAMDPQDLDLIRPLQARYSLSSQPVRWHDETSETLEALRRLDILIGQRLHAVIAASGMGIPSISIAHCLKAEDFMHSIQRQDYCVKAGVVSEQLVALVEEIDQEYERHAELVIKACDNLRALQRQAGAEVRRLVGPTAL